METPMTPLTLTDTAETALVLRLLKKNRDSLIMIWSLLTGFYPLSKLEKMSQLSSGEVVWIE
jgi:hypothetical protein